MLLAAGVVAVRHVVLTQPLPDEGVVMNILFLDIDNALQDPI